MKAETSLRIILSWDDYAPILAAHIQRHRKTFGVPRGKFELTMKEPAINASNGAIELRLTQVSE